MVICHTRITPGNTRWIDRPGRGHEGFDPSLLRCFPDILAHRKLTTAADKPCIAQPAPSKKNRSVWNTLNAVQIRNNWRKRNLPYHRASFQTVVHALEADHDFRQAAIQAFFVKSEGFRPAAIQRASRLALPLRMAEPPQGLPRRTARAMTRAARRCTPVRETNSRLFRHCEGPWQSRRPRGLLRRFGGLNRRRDCHVAQPGP